MQTEFYWRRVSVVGKLTLATVNSTLTVANEKWDASYMYSHSNANSVFGLIYRSTPYFVEKCHFATLLLWLHINTIRFVHGHLTASKKGELTNQNAAYWIIALEFLFFAVNKYDSLQCNFFSRLLTKGNTFFHFHNIIQIGVMKFLSSFPNTENVNLLFNSRNFIIVSIYQLVLVYL